MQMDESEEQCANAASLICETTEIDSKVTRETLAQCAQLQDAKLVTVFGIVNSVALPR
jgi:hypothetical protein